MESKVIIVDDRDSRIIYDGQWLQTVGGRFFRNTTSASNNAGDTAAYTFRGTGINVIGTVPIAGDKRPTTSGCQLDGEKEIIYIAELDEVDRHRRMFFSASSLEDREYRLLIRYIGGATLFLDMFEVTAEEPRASSFATITSTIINTLSSPGPSMASSSPFSSQAVSPTPPGSTGLPAGMLAAVAVLGTVVCLMLGIVIILLRRLRRTSHSPGASEIQSEFKTLRPLRSTPTSTMPTRPILSRFLKTSRGTATSSAESDSTRQRPITPYLQTTPNAQSGMSKLASGDVPPAYQSGT